MTKTLTATYGGYLIKQDEAQKRPFVYVKNTKTNASDLIDLSSRYVCSTITQLRRYLKYLLSTNKLQHLQNQKNDEGIVITLDDLSNDCCNCAGFDDDDDDYK